MSLSKQKIVNEALRLFSTNGYEATSINTYLDCIADDERSVNSYEELEIKSKNHDWNFDNSYFVYEFALFYCQQSNERDDAGNRT